MCQRCTVADAGGVEFTLKIGGFTTCEQHLTEMYRLFMTKKGELSSYNMGEEFF
jgi:hypothetical protein